MKKYPKMTPKQLLFWRTVNQSLLKEKETNPNLTGGVDTLLDFADEEILAEKPKQTEGRETITFHKAILA
jgi:hypothetical protein